MTTRRPRLLLLLGFLATADAYSPTLQQRTKHAMWSQRRTLAGASAVTLPPIVPAGSCSRMGHARMSSLEPFSAEQQETLRAVKAKCFPVDQSAVVYDLASPFSWSRIRQDHPDLASFSNDELADGMRELGWVEGMAPFEESTAGDTDVPLEARFYQVALPLMVVFLVVTQFKPDLIPSSGAP